MERGMSAATDYTPSDYEETRVDWNGLVDVPDEQWLCEPLIRANSVHSLTADAKRGKSLLLLDAAFGIASGRPCLLKEETVPRNVLYLDFEMGKSKLKRRRDKMGAQHVDCSRLTYLQHPPLPSLHTERGGEHLAALVERYEAEVLIIDTLSKAVIGEEDSATTYNAFARWSVGPVVGLGAAVLWADHFGYKNKSHGRGSSSKLGIVDVALTLKGRGGATSKDELVLEAREDRESAWPTESNITRVDKPYLIHNVEDSLSPGVRRVVDLIQRDGVERTNRKVQDAAACSPKTATAALKFLAEADARRAA